MMMLRENKGNIFSSRENYFSNIGTKGRSAFRIFGKSKEFVPTGRTYGVLEHPKLNEIYLLIKNWILGGSDNLINE